MNNQKIKYLSFAPGFITLPASTHASGFALIE